MYTVDLLTPYGLLAAFGAALAGALAGLWVWRAWGREGLFRSPAAWLLAGAPLALFVFAVATLAVDVPYWDDYDALLGYLSRPARLAHLFDLHNEHRIVTVRAVAEALLRVCGRFDFRAMIAVGNLLFLAYVALLVRRLFFVRGGLPLPWLVPALWALLSILMYENMLWALTAVQSNAVLLFAWLALWGLERAGRGGWGWFAFSLANAWLCTYTSGSGLFVWFCLAGMALKRWRLDGARLCPAQAAVLAAAGAVTVAGYLRGFAGGGGAGAALAHPGRVLAYAALFCGGAFHAAPLALPAGACVLGFAAWQVLRLPRVRENAVFFFFGFLLCAGCAAALFRSGEAAGQALSFRYRVVAVSILLCCGALAYRQAPAWLLRYARPACALVTAACVWMNLAAYLLAYPQLAARRDRLVEGVRAWPERCGGLVYPDTSLAGEALRRSVEAGVYRPPR